MTTVVPLKRRWVTVAYVQELTGFARPTIYKMAREGRIPAQRIGRSVRFDATEIDRWISKAPKASA